MKGCGGLIHAGDEEEGAALVPLPAADELQEAPHKVVDDDGDAAEPTVERQPPSSSATTTTRPCWKTPLLSPTKGAVGLVIGGLVLLALLAGAGWVDLDASFLRGNGSGTGRRWRHPPRRQRSSPPVPIPFSCGNGTSLSSTPLCRRPRVGMPPPAASPSPAAPPPPSCPDYFRHIHSDLEPWREKGISREAVERGRPKAAFRLTVVSGRAYVETYHRVFQTRDLFTQWGIAQLLARYPGRVPDLDLMFNCEDMPELRAADYPDTSAAPPLFRYCKDGTSLEVLFPDWSFWGWPEVNIRPWGPLMKEIAEENARLPWPDRQPYAFWKGNPDVSRARRDLFRCSNDSAAGRDWNARLFALDWGAANRNGFKGSTNLAEQCRYRYKIYVQGRSWSVSEKYILACDSPMLAIDTPFDDFFSRGLVAGRHYWPVDPGDKCRAVKFAVDWGNAHPALAQRMGKEGSGFAREDMSMDYVYDYMLHVLTHYAALLRYKPTVPDKAVELCPESMACSAQGRDREFMMESREMYEAGYEPCTMPPPFTAEEAREMAAREKDVRRKVVKMEGR
uniref:Predicted protein n=1 Tax=Hordeum vulgare subsp. vulgare TaxID=112509 RepID=F2D940_HORVV|nr:predicted protein [Hordeum vulgare subsp. vulgare]BAJ95415.1 predicted protein [Hordeum vulgare subsp. vulgare]